MTLGNASRSCSVDDSLEEGVDASMPKSAQESAARWYCVQTLPKKELVAAENLALQSYRYLLPTFVKTIRHARKTTKVKRALFPGYLFVSIDMRTQPWWPIKGTIGVRNMIMDNDRPKMVPIGVVEELIAATNEDGHIDYRHKIEVGQNVRLMSGPFFNLVGRLERLDEKGRVAVLLSILGGERLVVADKAALQPIET